MTQQTAPAESPAPPAGGDLVRITIQGTGAMLKVVIDPSLLTSDGADDLADLILAAHADAKKQLDDAQAAMMRQAMGPLAGMAGGMPGFPGLKF